MYDYPRIPVFSFWYAKVLSVTKKKKCGKMSVLMKWRHLGYFQLLSRVVSPFTVVAEMEVSRQGKMANPQGMKVFAVERHRLSDDFMSFRICVEFNHHHSYLLRNVRLSGVLYSGRHRERLCV